MNQVHDLHGPGCLMLDDWVAFPDYLKGENQ